MSEAASSFHVTDLTAVVVWENGTYVAHCPQVGTAGQGKTVEKAVANLKEATELYLEAFPQEWPKDPAAGPIVATFSLSGKAPASAVAKRQ